MIFNNRQEAGRLLASHLHNYKEQKNTIVLGLARGGFVVAFELAQALLLPLNVVVPRKIGAPGMPELAIGSIMETGEVVYNDSIIHTLGISQEYIHQEIKKEQATIQKRLALYRQHAPLPNLKNQTVILVDDGVATGATMLVVVKAMRQAQAHQVIVAIPVASDDALEMIEEVADEVYCIYHQENFGGVGFYYRNFSQTEDGEVIKLLEKANKQIRERSSLEQAIQISIDPIRIEGILSIPKDAQALILFAHGSGSSRFSPRNQFVAKLLNEKKLATLLIDLLTNEEELIDQYTRQFRFDIERLTKRLLSVTNWLSKNADTQHLAIGYFGSSTGAASALMAAAEKETKVFAIVSRGGRPDLALAYLKQVQSPTLLIVGGLDKEVIELNRQAYSELSCEKKLEIIPHATHLFEETGALEEVARLAAEWFLTHLT
jgi:putative phosphoribosyl transferase